MEKKNEKKEIMSIQDMIYEIRSQKVMLDSDLARLYGVELRVLNQTVKRNIERFPQEFMFQLTDKEWKEQRSQFVIFNKDTRKFKPYAFTEYGILMLSSVLNSRKAIDINVQIIKIFVQIRRALSQSNLNEQYEKLHKLLMLHIDTCDYKFNEHDESIRQISEILNNLIEQPKPAKKIGFSVN